MKSFARHSPKIEVAVLLVSLAASALSARSLAAELSASVVTIYARSTKHGSAQGTGFVFGDGGRVATAYHVVQDATQLEVFDRNFRRMTAVTVEWIEPSKDVAIIRVDEASNLPALRLSTSTPTSHHEVKVAGSPRGLPKQVLFGRLTSAGYVSSLGLSSAGGRQLFSRNVDILPIDVTIYSGMSGAPVLSENGLVLGVLSGSFDEGRGIGWAIPAKYIDELMKTSPINLRIDSMKNWPELSLMAPGWVSLKRSYAKQFTSEHIAKLEVLEGAFRTLKGTWQGRSKEQTIIYDDLMLGRCEILASQEIQLKVDRVDQDGPRITGHQTMALSTEVEFTDAPQAFDNPILAAQRREFCSQRVFNDRMRSDADAHLEGDFSLEAKVSKNSMQAERSYRTTMAITECQGSACTPKVFGPQKAGALEMISLSKIRWQNTILSKMP